MRRLIKKKLRDIIYNIGSIRSGKDIFLPPPDVKAVILMYHRVLPGKIVGDRNIPTSDLVVSLERFTEQMEFLANHYKLLRMDELSDHLENGEGVAVAVTFDDGYKDNMVHAFPILKRYGIPATIYVATRFPEGDCKMWWYELWEICEKRNSINFKWNGYEYKWVLKQLKQKIRCYSAIRKIILAMEDHRVEELMGIIRDGRDPVDYPDYCLNWEDICFLARNKSIISIGAHTHSHANLGIVSHKKGIEEILKSKRLVEEKTGLVVNHFAFPFGTKKHISEWCGHVLREQMFESGVTTYWDGVRKGSDRFLLPRVPVFEEDTAGRLELKISGWNSLLLRLL